MTWKALWQDTPILLTLNYYMISGQAGNGRSQGVSGELAVGYFDLYTKVSLFVEFSVSAVSSISFLSANLTLYMSYINVYFTHIFEQMFISHPQYVRDHGDPAYTTVM